MTERPFPDSPPLFSPAGATPPVDFDETLGRAIDAGRLDPALAAADANLAGAFAAHQKLESLFAALRGDADPLSLRERARVRADCIADDPPAQLGRYQVRSTLGAGAFGTVYLAHDPELNRDVAVKVSRAGAFASAGAFDKFRAKARHAASLNHPNIVSVDDVGREGDRLYIVIQYVTNYNCLRSNQLKRLFSQPWQKQWAERLTHCFVSETLSRCGRIPRRLFR